MAEEVQTQGSKDDCDRTALVNGLRRLGKMEDEEEKQVKKVKQDEECLRVQKQQIRREEEIVWELKKISEELREERKTQEGEVWLEFEGK